MNHQFYTSKSLLFTCQHRAGTLRTHYLLVVVSFLRSFRPASDPKVQEDLGIFFIQKKITKVI